jgi:hypothetical protein
VGSLNGHGARLVSVTPARRSLEDLLVAEVRRAGGAAGEPRVTEDGAGDSR